MMSKNYSSTIIPTFIIESLEQVWKFKLPEDYRTYLCNNNGESVENKVFSFKEIDSKAILDRFFGFAKDLNRNILLYYQDSGIRYPNNMFAIGDACGGNLILLFVKGPDRNKVYFWDHEQEVEEGETPDYSNLTLIADNFTEFIENLRDE